MISTRLILQELAIRNHRKPIKNPDILDRNFKPQTNFILDSARLKAAFCTRRAAKSYTGGLYLVKEALENPGCNCLFMGLTRASAQGIIWKDILKDIDKKHELDISFNESFLTATLPNESVIYVTGVDADESEMEKLLGKKYRLAVLDEASMYSIDQRRLVYGILKPAVADNRGTICMLGTSGNETQTLFYDVTKKEGEREPGWSVHEWTAHENPYVAKQWQEELDEIDRDRPLFKATPLFRQWYLNLWEIDTDALVYKYNPTLNLAPYLPRELSDWHYLLGVDLGHSPDSTSFIVGAYHPGDPNLYIVSAEKYLKMDFTAVAEKTLELEKTYNFEVKVVDGANKQGIAEMNNRHSTGFIIAEKHGKVEYINLMNGDLRQGKIKLLPGAMPLSKEWKVLVWVTEGGKIIEPRKEHAAIENHLSDGALYLWRYAYTYLFQAPKPFVPREAQESWEPDHIKKLQDAVRKEQNPDELSLDWDEDWTPD